MKRVSLAIKPGKALALGLSFMLACMAIFSVGMFAAAGQTAGNTTEIANSTVSVDSSTQSVYGEVNATDATSNVTVDVSYLGIGADGTESLDAEKNGKVVTAGSTELFEHTPNATKYDEYRVVVVAQSDSTNATATVGTIEKVAGSGGGLLDSAGSVGGGAIAVVVVAGAFLLTRGD